MKRRSPCLKYKFNKIEKYIDEVQKLKNSDIKVSSLMLKYRNN